MDLTGRMIERSAAIQWRIANSNALLNTHLYQHWDEVGELLMHLPEQYQKRANHLVEEGKNMANVCIKSALDAAETSSRQMMLGITGDTPGSISQVSKQRFKVISSAHPSANTCPAPQSTIN